MYNDPVLDVRSPEPPAPVAEGTAGGQRFASCRWHKPAEADLPAHCTQRDVLSLAGAHGFSPDSWCVDCAYFKVRRVVRKPA
jgi:hypothetical protein